jgi:ABC-type Fe3+-hydroxamate transport system substrate-binding protein
MTTDDLGFAYDGLQPARRVVSLVPSITEALASSHPEALVGATDYCTHPASLSVARIRGTKNPDLAAIRELAPDVVIANKEENRELDVRRLRDAGVRVWVTDIETVPQAVASLGRVFSEALGWTAPGWLEVASQLWSQRIPSTRGILAIPIWRDPWMVVGHSTFTGDVARRLGWANAFDNRNDRYPRVALAEIDRKDLDLVLLPDEPYPFDQSDGPEAFEHMETRLVSGRLLTWYGPSLVAAHRELTDLLT